MTMLEFCAASAFLLPATEGAAHVPFTDEELAVLEEIRQGQQ